MRLFNAKHLSELSTLALFEQTVLHQGSTKTSGHADATNFLHIRLNHAPSLVHRFWNIVASVRNLAGKFALRHWISEFVRDSLSVLYQRQRIRSIMFPFITQLFSDPLWAIVYLVSIVVAITIHEFAHAWTADLLGDDTPGLMGRVTLNPLAHLDPIGSLCFLLLGFGWGKPVIYNPMRLARRLDELWIALAGPLSNILLAIALHALAFLSARYNLTFLSPTILDAVAGTNVLLAAFNMLPIPPLDGSSIVAFFWPDYRSVVGGQIGLVILLLLIFTGALSAILTPIIFGFAHVATLFGALGHLVTLFGTFG